MFTGQKSRKVGGGIFFFPFKEVVSEVERRLFWPAGVIILGTVSKAGGWGVKSALGGVRGVITPVSQLPLAAPSCREQQSGAPTVGGQTPGGPELAGKDRSQSMSERKYPIL